MNGVLEYWSDGVLLKSDLTTKVTKYTKLKGDGPLNPPKICCSTKISCGLAKIWAPKHPRLRCTPQRNGERSAPYETS
jgi:hypothetical protein